MSDQLQSVKFPTRAVPVATLHTGAVSVSAEREREREGGVKLKHFIFHTL